MHLSCHFPKDVEHHQHDGNKAPFYMPPHWMAMPFGLRQSIVQDACEEGGGRETVDDHHLPARTAKPARLLMQLREFVTRMQFRSAIIPPFDRISAAATQPDDDASRTIQPPGLNVIRTTFTFCKRKSKKKKKKQSFAIGMAFSSFFVHAAAKLSK